MNYRHELLKTRYMAPSKALQHVDAILGDMHLEKTIFERDDLDDLIELAFEIQRCLECFCQATALLVQVEDEH